MSQPHAIDWDTAQRVGELIAGAPRYGSPSVQAPDRSAQNLVHEFARRVSAYTRLQITDELPPLEMVDRRSWIAANLLTMRPLLDPLAKRMGESSDSGLLRGPLRAAPGHLLGAQLGVVTGLLSQRVLGQYDVSLLDAEAPSRLLLLAPNLAAAARNLGVDRGELTTWVAIHEITHAVQFSGAPWLREHLGGMVRELLDGMSPGAAAPDTSGASQADGDEAFEDRGEDTGDGDGDGDGYGNGNGDGDGDGNGNGALSWLTDPKALLARAREIKAGELKAGELAGRASELAGKAGELRGLIERARQGELLRIGLGDERWALVQRMQATMSLIEGHAEHTMDAVGAEVLPTLPNLRSALTRRRESRPLPWRVLEKVLGLELKMRQYEVGRRFCDAVVDTGGPELLALAWRSPQELPTAEELSEPERWIERVRVAA